MAPGRQSHSAAGSTSGHPGSPCPPGRGRSRGRRDPRGLPLGRCQVSLQRQWAAGMRGEAAPASPQGSARSPDFARFLCQLLPEPSWVPPHALSWIPSHTPCPLQELWTGGARSTQRAAPWQWGWQKDGDRDRAEWCQLPLEGGGAGRCATVLYLLLGGCSGTGSPRSSTCASQGSWSHWHRVGALGAGSA